MRPAPVAAGFQLCRPGNVSRDAKSGSCAKAKREMLSAMPLEVSSFTKSRREVLTIPPSCFALRLGTSTPRPRALLLDVLEVISAGTTVKFEDRRIGDHHNGVTGRILQDCKLQIANVNRQARRVPSEYELRHRCVKL